MQKLVKSAFISFLLLALCLSGLRPGFALAPFSRMQLPMNQPYPTERVEVSENLLQRIPKPRFGGPTVRLFRGMTQKVLTMTAEQGFQPVPLEAILRKSEGPGMYFHDDAILHQGRHALTGKPVHAFFYGNVLGASKLNPILVLDMPVETLLEEDVLVLSQDALDYFVEAIFSEQNLIETGLLKAVLLNQKDVFPEQVRNKNGQITEGWHSTKLKVIMGIFLEKEKELFLQLVPEIKETLKEHVRYSYKAFHKAYREFAAVNKGKSADLIQGAFLGKVFGSQLIFPGIVRADINYHEEDAPILPNVIFKLSEEEYLEYFFGLREEEQDPETKQKIKFHYDYAVSHYLLEFDENDYAAAETNPGLLNLLARSLAVVLKKEKTTDNISPDKINESVHFSGFKELDFASDLLDLIQNSDHPLFQELRERYKSLCHEKSEANKAEIRRLMHSPQKLQAFISSVTEVIMPHHLLNAYLSRLKKLSGEIKDYVYFANEQKLVYCPEISFQVFELFRFFEFYREPESFSFDRTTERLNQFVLDSFVLKFKFGGKEIPLFKLRQFKFWDENRQLTSSPQILMKPFFAALLDKENPELLKHIFQQAPEQIVDFLKAVLTDQSLQQTVFQQADYPIDWRRFNRELADILANRNLPLTVDTAI